MSESTEETQHRAIAREFRDDVDLRLLNAELIDALEVFADDDRRTMAIRLLRLAYYKGYRDAFVEPRIGSLFMDHGRQIPRRNLT